ncbi:S-adenosylmethionine-dependent methyltransferase [Melia azedarach]|uniref:S-adenosylmethionine-dependent methyltransferase n=1 Tax=Melia azedarach TaxID=155640 RepID=A0ACC1X6H7_MELAZ|nr:S-adenosylmethionine-dependent methyltransferase [Melia azedarach]
MYIYIYLICIYFQLEEGKIYKMAKDAAAVISPESYPMVGGDGDHSYAKNSRYQREVVDAAKEILYEAISNKLDLKSLGLIEASKTFQLADLGCSVGPNTFIAVQNIIEAVELKYQAEAQHHQDPSSALEFQVFFNDHIGNDFNVLFRSLPPSRKYFAAGVPGSFHGRLFSKSSLHVVHSSNALHWLSKVPKDIVDSKSPAWNKESIYCTGYVKEVAEAYAAQFKNDMDSFLNARAQELVPGGLMVIVLPNLPNGVPMSDSSEGKIYDFLGSCLVDIAKMGLIPEEKVESFNFPIYYPTAKEFLGIIERNGSFSIEKMEILSNPAILNMKFSAEFVTSNIRAVFEGIIKEHFGSELVDQIFSHFTKNFAENAFILEDIKDQKKDNSFFLLKRIVN